MKTTVKNNKWIIIKGIILVSILTPLFVIAYETIYLGKHSVVFFDGYPTVIGIIVMIYYSILIVMGLIWMIKQLKSILTLKNEQTKNEILHLQNQVSPHFFFNILNNLYGLIGKDSDRAKVLVLKLSDLMRYSIYEGEKEYVSIFEEVAFLKNYIELHQMRYHKSIDIKFNEQVEHDFKIVPLLLIVLLENAFKHGVENLRENAYVDIDLYVDEKQITFKIENNFDIDNDELKPGIGLKNLKRRLNLLYPKKHDLIISKNNSTYKASLKIFA